MSKIDKSPISEMEQLASSITEGSKNILKDILSEAVSDFFHKELLKEDENNEDKEETVEDENEKTSEFEKSEETSEETDVEETSEEEDPANDEVTEDVNSEGDEWSDFDDYKIGDEEGSEEYDFTNETNPETLVKVFKLMKNEDQVSVVKDGDRITIKDNDAETEYVIELDDTSMENNNDLNDEFTMTESLGYTDNYQDKDPIEGLSMDNSTPKNTKDWHKGVPTGTKKPWAGKGDSKPFGEKPKKEEMVFEVTLNDEVENEEEIVEATNVGGFVQQNTTTKSHVPNSNGRKARNMSKGGQKVTSTSEPRYSEVSESIQRKIDAALLENKQLKETVAKVSKIMKEAVQVNVNLGHIVRLMVENSTTKEEKENIVKRFNNVKTNDEAKNLYESISSELKTAHSSIITEQPTTVEPKKINESKIYDEQPNSVLNMMKRMNIIK